MQKNISLKDFNTWNVGGECREFFAPQSLDELYQNMPELSEKASDVCVLGGGSNVLVADGLIDSIVVHTPQMKGFIISSSSDGRVEIEISSGITTKELLSFALKNNLTGVEVLTGIPGTLGGALWGNAGAAGTDLSPVLKRAETVLRNGELVVWEKGDLSWEYRKSPFEEKDVMLITKAVLSMQEVTPEEVRKNMARFAQLKKGQPLAKKTAGCVFKNPAGYSAGRLLDEAGCKQLSVGDATVSSAHANFIENNGNASASDIYTLTQLCKKRVAEQFGVELEYEIRMLGSFS